MHPTHPEPLTDEDCKHLNCGYLVGLSKPRDLPVIIDMNSYLKHQFTGFTSPYG